MKAQTRLLLSHGKQRLLALSHIAQGALATRKLHVLQREEHGRGDQTATGARGFLHLEKVIEDDNSLLVRLRATGLPLDPDECAWTCQRADGSQVACAAYVLDAAACTASADGHLLVSLRVAKAIEGLLVSVRNRDTGALAATLVIGEGELWHALRENQLLVASAMEDFSYPRWFEQCKTSESELARQRVSSFADEPIFSIIVPLYKTPLGFFHDMLASVEAQTYPYWQLVLVNASPEDAQLAEAVADAAAREPRITIVRMEENLGITLNTNAGIRASIGDFLAFFDHDDVLEPDILFEYARAINEHPDTDMLYCDEDNLMPEGDFLHPHFKPDFSPDLLRCHNYMCHMLAVRTSVHATLTPAGREFDGAQDHHCALRMSELARRVHHVPRVLYHWRINASSVADNPDAKPYCTEAGVRAVQQHIDRLGWAGAVGPAALPFRYHIAWQITGDPLVSIIIPLCDSADEAHLPACLASIREKTDYARCEIIVVRNAAKMTTGGCAARGSTPGEGVTREGLAREGVPGTTAPNEAPAAFSLTQRDVEVAATQDAFSTLANFGASCAAGEYLVLLNPQCTVITPTWIEELLGFCQREDVGAVGAKLLRPDGTVYHTGLMLTEHAIAHLDIDTTPFQHSYFDLREDPQNLDAVSAGCMMTKRTDFLAHGGFDARIGIAHDVAYCLALADNGLRIVYNPHAMLFCAGPVPVIDQAAFAATTQRNADRAFPSVRHYSHQLAQDAPACHYRHLGHAPHASRAPHARP